MAETTLAAGLRGNERVRRIGGNNARGDLLHRDVTQQVIEAFYETYNELGPGFLESVYAVSLAAVVGGRGLEVRREAPIDVHFRGEIVGRFYADLVVGDRVVVELKVAEALRREHEAQLLNYLKATQVEVGLLLNFGLKPQFKRLVMSNDRKAALQQHNPPVPAETRG